MVGALVLIGFVAVGPCGTAVGADVKLQFVVVVLEQSRKDVVAK